jgi:Holliday junction resolvasome RuvABC endonuclease subunit
MIHRLIKIKKFIEEVVIPQWKPDFIVMEDIQYQQNGLTTYKVLAMLLGLIQVQLVEQGIKYEVVSPNV